MNLRRSELFLVRCLNIPLIMKIILALCVAVGVATAVILEPRPFRRRLPADKLRGKWILISSVYFSFNFQCFLSDFDGMCFASTQCRVYNVSESWSLAPFCGQATCRLGKSSECRPTSILRSH